MSSNSGKDLGHEAGEITGQAQVKRDEYVSQAKETYQTAMDSASGTAQSTRSYTSDLKDQATNLIQQTGEQVKSMAQGAAEAVKSTLGMNSTDGSTAGITNNRPASNPSNPITGNSPGNLVSSGNPGNRA